MQVHGIIVVGGLVAVLGLNGCAEDAKSEDIRTSGIYAGMDVTAGAADSSKIDLYLKVGGRSSNTYLTLTNGDQLTALLNGSVSKTLTKSVNGVGETHYLTTFSDASAGMASSSYVISFNRTTDEDALNSTVLMPAAVANLAIDKSTFSRSTDAVTLTWTGTDNTKQLALNIAGDCINTTEFSVVDLGSYVINAGTLMPSGSPSVNCVVSFKLGRTQSGTIDSAFGEGGNIRATNSRSIGANSTP